VVGYLHTAHETEELAKEGAAWAYDGDCMGEVTQERFQFLAGASLPSTPSLNQFLQPLELVKG
jgi:hypothetical protein